MRIKCGNKFFFYGMMNSKICIGFINTVTKQVKIKDKFIFLNIYLKIKSKI